MFIVVLINAITTIIKQQKILNGYSVQEKNLKIEISEAKERQEQLNNEKENVNSLEHIETLA